MLYDVSQVSIKLNVSKQSIYSKLKLKPYKDKIIRKAGKTYIDEDLFNLIKDTFKVESNFKRRLKVDETAVCEKSEDIRLENDSFNLNQELIHTLIEQLKIKDTQIQELNDRLAAEQELTRNRQILELKQQPDIKQIEEHIKDFDNKLTEIRENMKQRKQQSIFERIFKK